MCVPVTASTQRFLGLSPSTSSTASSESGFSSLSYSDCRLYFSKEKMLCEEETPKSQRAEEESKESSSSSSEEDEGEDEASESEAEKEAGDPEAVRPQSMGGRRVSEGRWSRPGGTDSQTGAPDHFLLPSHHVKPLQLLGGWEEEHSPGYLADS